MNISDTNPYAVPNGFMQNGSLTIGDISLNYGGNYYTGQNWTGNNTAGLLMECLDNTEIAIYDYGTRIMGAIQYLGGTANTLILGRDMGWGTIAKTILNGNVGIGITNPSSNDFINFE